MFPLTYAFSSGKATERVGGARTRGVTSVVGVEKIRPAMATWDRYASAR